MARNKNKQYTETKNYTVYVILHPHTKEFFVNFVTTGSLRNVMKQHYTLNNYYTKEMFEKHKETIYPPEMYSLEENEMTLGDCFVRKILWIRYFKEKGYVPLNHEDDVSSSDNLFEENIPEYERMKDLDINEIICSSNRKFSRYGRERMEHIPYDEKKQINFRVSEEEYNLIRNNAKKRNKTLTAYIKDVSINTVSVDFNYDAIIEHTNEINRIRAELHAIITMLVKTNQAFPNDIEKMIELLQEINQSEKLMLQRTQKERTAYQKYVKNLIARK